MREQSRYQRGGRIVPASPAARADARRGLALLALAIVSTPAHALSVDAWAPRRAFAEAEAVVMAVVSASRQEIVAVGAAEYPVTVVSVTLEEVLGGAAPVNPTLDIAFPGGDLQGHTVMLAGAPTPPALGARIVVGVAVTPDGTRHHVTSFEAALFSTTTHLGHEVVLNAYGRTVVDLGCDGSPLLAYSMDDTFGHLNLDLLECDPSGVWSDDPLAEAVSLHHFLDAVAACVLP